jgi:predicted XRE-type DNA-binding protein
MPNAALTRDELTERVRDAVRENNLTQQQVADRLGVTQSAVAQAMSDEYDGVDKLRMQILEEIGEEEVEPGFLVRS